MNNDFAQINNPAWVKKSEEFVNTFLAEKNSPQRLIIQQCATTHSFQSVMIYCIQLIDANSVVNDFKKDVPKILEKLGYPHNLRSGKWAACTTPQNWPKLLFVLRWVVELCKYMDICKQTDWVVPNNPDSCVALDKELEFYYNWRDKKSTMDDIQEQFINEINEESGSEINEYNKLLTEVQRDRLILAETMKRKETQKEKIVQLDNLKRTISDMRSNIETIEDKCAKLKTDIDCRNIEQQSLEEKKASLESSLEEVQRQIDEQPMTSEEVKKMKTRLNDLSDQHEETFLGIKYHEKGNKDLSENVIMQYNTTLVPYANKFNDLAKELGFSSNEEDAVFEIDPPKFEEFLRDGIHIGNAKAVPNILEKQKAESEAKELEVKQKMAKLKTNNHDLKNELEVLKKKQALLQKTILGHQDDRKKMKIKNQEELHNIQNFCNKKSSENENQEQAIKYEGEAKDKELQELEDELAEMKRQREHFLMKQQNEISPQIYDFMDLMQTMDDVQDEQIAFMTRHLEWLTNGDQSESPI